MNGLRFLAFMPLEIMSGGILVILGLFRWRCFPLLWIGAVLVGNLAYWGLS